MKWQLFWTITTPLLLPLCILGALGTRTMRSLHRFFLLLCHRDFPLYSVGSLSSTHSCKPCCFSRRDLCGDRSTVLQKFETNVQHWPKQVWWNDAEVSQRPLPKLISAPGVLVQIAVLEKGVHALKCVIAAQLWQQLTFIIQVSIISFV